MIGFSWTHLGAFSANIGNVSPAQLDGFADAGGRWIIPVLYNDESSAEKNLAELPQKKLWFASKGIRTGCWANVYGDDPDKACADVKAIVTKYGLSPVVFDAEIAYQGNTKMAELAESMRKTWPLGTKALAVSTNAPNDSCVYNGRTGPYPAPVNKSFRTKNIHLLPQWYSAKKADGSWLYWGKWTHADQTMEWVQSNGMLDNWEDLGQNDHRAIKPGTMIHGTLEVTGLENASLQESIDECVVARQHYGLGKGISIYLLENTPVADFPRLKAQQGYLYT